MFLDHCVKIFSKIFSFLLQKEHPDIEYEALLLYEKEFLKDHGYLRRSNVFFPHQAVRSFLKLIKRRVLKSHDID